MPDQSWSWGNGSRECALFYCVNEYEASVIGGNLHQVVRQTWRNDSASPDADGRLVYRPPSSIINATSNGSLFYVDDLAAKALNEFMSRSLTGIGVIYDNQSSSPTFSSDIIHALYETDHLPTRLDNMVVSMTNNMRSQNNSMSYAVRGEALEGKTFLQVRWAWLGYSAVVLALSICCLIATIFETETSNVPVWKTSEIVMLYQGQRLQSWDTSHVHGSRMSVLTEEAGKTTAKLICNEEQGNWELKE